jgi:hypothetical protein
MPNTELAAFFRENTQDLPETAGRWFRLPHPIQFLPQSRE